jgi:hypothetical protein
MNGNKIQELKTDTDFINEEINFIKVIAAKLYSLNKKEFIKFFLLGLFYWPDFKLQRKNKDNSGFLFSKNFNCNARPDYQDIYDNVSSIQDNTTLNIDRKVSPVSIIDFALKFPKRLIKNYSKKLTILEVLAITSLEVYFLRVLDEVKKIDLNQFQFYLSFCDSYLEENLLAQYCKNKKIKTATLQHGQFKYTKNNITTDSEAYLNFVSDFIIVWGEATKKEFSRAGVDKTRIIVAGVPKHIYGCSSKTDKYSAFACIYLNGDLHSDSNNDMLKIAVTVLRKKNLNYKIRCHPSSSFVVKENYNTDPLFKGYSLERGGNFEYNILHISGVLVDLLMNNENTIIYQDKKNIGLYHDLNIGFSTEIELTKIMTEKKKLTEKIKLAKKYLNVAEDFDSINDNYLLAFDKIKK